MFVMLMETLTGFSESRDHSCFISFGLRLDDDV